jgi:hypothetical protein
MHIESVAAIVTGAASGLGAATSAELAARGAKVYGLDLPGSIAGVAAPDGVTYVEADVTDPEQVQARGRRGSLRRPAADRRELRRDRPPGRGSWDAPECTIQACSPGSYR